MRLAWIGVAAAVLLATPALADDDYVRAGVDAWARGDYARAVEQWRGPANAGDADAEFNLGQAYKLGRGVPAMDLAQAEEWYRRAALQGHPQAQDNYGLALFQNGKHAEAVEWLQRSAQRGEPRAQFVLGTMYFNGDAVAKDWVRAYALITRASASGLPQATQTLAQMDRYISLPDRQEAIELAKRYEQEESKAPTQVAVSGGQPVRPGTIGTAELPPSAAYQGPAELGSTAALKPTAKPRRGRTTPTPVPAPVPGLDLGPPLEPVTRPRPAPAPVDVAATRPKPAPAPMPVRAGGWRIQLGAFGDPGNARKLWAQVAGRFPGRQPSFVKAGALTKLLVGPYASGAEAGRACATVKPCIPVAP